MKILGDYISANLQDLDECIRSDVEYFGIEDFVDEMKKYITCERYGQVQTIEIKLDSEESNGNSNIFDFLASKIQEDVMKSKVMEVYSCSFDTRAGMSAYHYYITKSGREITPDRMIELIESSNFVD